MGYGWVNQHRRSRKLLRFGMIIVKKYEISLNFVEKSLDLIEI